MSSPTLARSIRLLVEEHGLYEVSTMLGACSNVAATSLRTSDTEKQALEQYHKDVVKANGRYYQSLFNAKLIS